jgi:Fic family protein
VVGGTSKKRPTPGRRRDQAFDTATKIVALFEADRTRISAEAAAAGSALRVHELLHRSALLTAPVAIQKTGLTTPTINAAFGELERLGIVSEVTGRKRGRVYSYRRFVELLSDAGGV